MTQATKLSGRLVITDEPVYTDAIPGYYSRKGPTDAGLAAQQTLSDLQQRTATLEKLNHNYTRLNELQALNAQQHTQWQNTQTELERTQQQTSQAQSALDALSETSYQMEGQHDLTGQTRHVGHETSEWSVACITPDVCRVGKRTIAFDSSATLGCKTQHSPNVKARGTPVYRVGDMSSGTQANAGKHVVSGTSGGKGYVKFNSGHDSVKVNGIPVVRHDSLVQINCNAAGIGGACGQVITQIKAPNSQAKKASEAAQAPAGKRTSPRLEQLKAEREALVADMWNLDYTDKWVRFDDAHDALDTAIDGIQGEEGTAYDYAAQVGRGIAGFGKDVVLGTAELLYEGVKLSPKLYRRLYGSNGQKLTQLDVAILEEEIQLGNITSDTLGEGALEIGGAIVEPVTTPWKEGDKVEAITRGGAEVAAIVVAPGKVISKLKTRKAGQLGTDGVSIKSDGGGAVHGVDEAADTGTMRDGDVVLNKTYLSNSTNPEIRQALLDRRQELRGELPSKLKREGNFGVAQVVIEGLPTELKAHSKINYVGDKGADRGFSLLKPQEDWVFTPKKVNSDGYLDVAGYLRHADTEFKLLEDIASRLGSNTQTTGKVNLFTERLTCQSCGDVILDFRNRYPNIQLNVFSRDLY